MAILKNGIYKVSSASGELFVGVGNKQHREGQRSHIKEGTPIVVVRQESLVRFFSLYRLNALLSLTIARHLWTSKISEATTTVSNLSKAPA
jgi:hypothetical protein